MSKKIIQSLLGETDTGRFLRVCLLGLLGYVLNFAGVQVSEQTELLLGGGIVFTVALVLGPTWGALCALIAALNPAIRWENPYYVLLAAGGAAFVAHMARRTPAWPPWIGVIVFWLVIEAPAEFYLYAFHYDVAAPTVWIILGKQLVNGLLWTWIAGAFAADARVVQFLTGLQAARTPQPLRQTLRRYFAMIATLPLLVVGLFFLRNIEQTILQQAEQNLLEAARTVESEIENQLASHHRAIVTLAQQAQSPSAADWATRLGVLQKNYPGFLTLLVSDGQGRLLAGYPPRNATGQDNLVATLTIEDRPYFLHPMRDRQPYMSGVFQGRGFGKDLIVALSAPYFAAAAEPAGIVEGSLNLRHLQELLPQRIHLPGAEIVLVDSRGRVVVAHALTGLATLDRIENSIIFQLSATPGRMAEHNHRRATGEVQMRYAGVALPIGRTGWMAYVRQPLAITLAPLFVFYASTLLALTLTLIVALWLSQRAVLQITHPVEKLAQAAASFSIGSAPTSPLHSQSGAPAEIASLSETFNSMAARLHHTYRDLQATAEERGRLNTELQTLLVELDQRVRDRTAELEKARQIAVAASKAKSEFLATMSHEIRTPLNGVIGMAEMLADARLPAEQAEQARIIRLSGHSLLSLVNDILDFSKIEAGSFTLLLEDFAPAALVKDSTEIIAYRTKAKGLTLHTRLDPTLPAMLHGDAPRISQILLNLVGNAAKFTAQGSITVEVTQVETQADRCLVRFAVRDTGIGIAPEKQKLVFDPFTQADGSITRQYGGTGLGLTISRKLTELMGGRIWVESTLGVGSCFQFEIPLRRAVAAPTPAPALAAPAVVAAPTRHFRVLVVDDDSINQLVAEAQISALGHFPQVVGSGDQAVERLKHEDFDLVFMDLHMLGLSGFAATRQIRQNEASRGRRTRIIALTADVTEETIASCREHDMDGWLAKPLRASKLKTILTD